MMGLHQLKKFLSYLWPFTRRYNSEINGTLEVTYINGKKVLDSENANYSYGKLQKILELGIKEVDLTSVENILLLGMGGGSIIHSLKEKFGYRGNITAVELDPKVIQIAETEFGIIETDRLQIIHQDAFEFVKNVHNRFQLIIIDLFIDTEIPSKFYGQEFCKNILRLNEHNGFLIYNMGISINDTLLIKDSLINHFEGNFSFQKSIKGLEVLLIGRKGKYCNSQES
ncbi:spermine synthase [Aequorivita sp. H23M31]|uniref:Spermine synthase n=1 Tax=Aequorivita ciconiae TaxID=2494375 RepID=A0A410G6N7_9FLAO|nr:fused MFS/spermidine synthase [Aequorivita sp. H23M31]QAA82900.1 spermine synthase [Aequorivita sp. H23M31]